MDVGKRQKTPELGSLLFTAYIKQQQFPLSPSITEVTHMGPVGCVLRGTLSLGNPHLL